ncbi:hypothetical protein OFN56_36505, partial [Escherichia coli]|nr:hypothetical protein [Escherichia coli]
KPAAFQYLFSERRPATAMHFLFYKVMPLAIMLQIELKTVLDLLRIYNPLCHLIFTDFYQSE